MKANRLAIIGVVMSVLISTASLAWQVKEYAPFARFFRPLSTSNITEADFRLLQAELRMVEKMTRSDTGIFPGANLEISRNRKFITAIIEVNSSFLPKDDNKRRSELLSAARYCSRALGTVFFDQALGLNKSYLEVIFVDPDFSLVAEYKNGKLTMR